MEESVEADSSAQMEVSSMGSDNMDVESNDCAEGAEESQDLAGVVKVSNISPQANMDQMKKLFGFLGDVQELALYPKGDEMEISSKTCYVKFKDKASCDVSQHLTNTVFIDRPLVVVPLTEADIPDEKTAMQDQNKENGFFNSEAFLDPFSSDPFQQVMIGLGPGTNLPPPPVLGNLDPVKLEEIRRTIYVGNLEESVTPEMLVAFFSGVGEIKYVRQSVHPESQERYALIEFTDLSAVLTALQYNGVIICGQPLKINYSRCTISKPDFEKLEAERKNADRHTRYTSRRRSSSLYRSKSRSRSRSRERSRRRSRSGSRRYSRSRRSRSRSKRRRSRSRSFSKSSRRRSRSRSAARRRRRSRSRSSDRRRRRSISKSRSRSRSRDKYGSSRRRDQQPSVLQSQKPISKQFVRRSSRSRSRERKKSRSRSRSASRSKEKKELDSETERGKDKDKSKEESEKDVAAEEKLVDDEKEESREKENQKESGKEKESKDRSRSRSRSPSDR